MSSLIIGRMTLTPPSAVPSEQVGDPVAGVGGAVAGAPRTPLQFQLAVATAAPGLVSAAKGQMLRRQLRSMLNNSPLKLGAFLYLIYGDDLEQNGWYVPDQTTLAGIDASSWLAQGLWQTAAAPWYVAGRRRTHREARSVWMKDLRTGLYPRDQLGWIYSTDFSALPALALTVLPNGAVSPALTVSGQVVLGTVLPAGRDGGACVQLSGLTDLAVVAYDRAESAMNLGDVVVYDRRGQITAPASGPDTSWQEVYGPDWPWNWLAAGQPSDAPVLDNGLVRVRYDASVGKPGFRVDVWTGSAYVEQGKLTIQRRGDSTGFVDTFVSATLVEWTPERAVVAVVLVNSADVFSRERVFITTQRGEIGVTFECYPAPKASGAAADASLCWTPAAADANDSLVKVDSQTQPPAAGAGVIAATAGSGSSSWGATTSLGASTFGSSENYVALLRCSALATTTAYQTNLIVVQAALFGASYSGGDTSAYGAVRNTVTFGSASGLGYSQLQVSFAPTVTDQVNEAESIRNTGSGTTSQVADATASGGQCVKDTQTANTAFTLSKPSTTLALGKYRVFARVKVDAGATGSFVGGGTNTTSTVTSTATAWTWLDMGQYLTSTTGEIFNFFGWRSAGASGAVYIDRIEMILVEDRARTNAIYSGARDAGQAALQDSRALGTIVAR